MSKPRGKSPLSSVPLSRRPAILIWRFILTDVWKLLALTTAVLVTVLSFAISVRLLADGRLGPLDTVRLMLFAMPPMLQYALPFAAGFAATLAYNRWNEDNEITAAYAAGISHRSLMAPVLLSGVVLGGAMFLLQSELIPRFLRSMDQLVTRDAARLIIGTIEQGDSFAPQGSDTQIFADLVRRLPPREVGDYEQLYLKGVVVVKLDKKGRVASEMSAEEADVWLRREIATARTPGVAESGTVEVGGVEEGEAVTRVITRLRGVRMRTHGKSETQAESTILPFIVPQTMKDDPKFLSNGQLRELRSEPDRMNFIDDKRRVLVKALSERAVTTRILQEMHAGGEFHLLDQHAGAVTIAADDMSYDGGVEFWILTRNDGAPFQIERSLQGGRVLKQTASSVRLRTELNNADPDEIVTLQVELEGVRTVGFGADSSSPPSSAAGGALRNVSITSLRLRDDPADAVARKHSPALLQTAAEFLLAHPPDAFVAPPTKELKRRIADLQREILSKQQERFAGSVACFIMVITGAVMALRLRGSLPLTVYLWAFFPALAAVITISAGQQMVHKHGPVGLLVLWGGVAALMLYTLLQFRRVARR